MFVLSVHEWFWVVNTNLCHTDVILAVCVILRQLMCYKI